MLKEENIDDGIDLGGNTNNRACLCNTYQSATCMVYCKAHSACLCTGCDARIHETNHVASQHERLWMCEACSTCDAAIHSANPLAHRHHRVPIFGSLYGPSGTVPSGLIMEPAAEANQTIDEEDEAASWLVLNPAKNTNQNNILLGGEVVDDYLNLFGDNSCQENQFTDQYNNQQQQYSVPPHKSYAGDSVVPVQCVEGKDQLHQQELLHQNFQLGMEYETSKAECGYPATISHNVSISSMDGSVVPESTISDVSISHPRPPKGTIDLFSSSPIHMPSQLTSMDREARVLRYREKKKTRKFEKTIRYASRKAYAETRPRIKGRFAKRKDAEVEGDQMFPTTLMGYGIVPSF